MSELKKGIEVGDWVLIKGSNPKHAFKVTNMWEDGTFSLNITGTFSGGSWKPDSLKKITEEEAYKILFHKPMINESSTELEQAKSRIEELEEIEELYYDKLDDNRQLTKELGLNIEKVDFYIYKSIYLETLDLLIEANDKGKELSIHSTLGCFKTLEECEKEAIEFTKDNMKAAYLLLSDDYKTGYKEGIEHYLNKHNNL